MMLGFEKCKWEKSCGYDICIPEFCKMNDREIILGMIEEYFEEQMESRMTITSGAITDLLIANGVTVHRHGRWEEYVNIKGVVRCSECNDTYFYREWVDEGKWYYCPNCGAKMEEENHD